MTANRAPNASSDLPSWKEISTILQWLFVIATIVTGLVKTNALPLVILTAGGLTFWIAHMMSENGKWFRISERHRNHRNDYYFPNRRQYFAALGWMVPTMTLGWLYLLPFPWAFQVVEYRKASVQFESWPFVTHFNVFTDTVYNYSNDQSVTFDASHPLVCTGTTKDAFKVQAQIGAALRLTFDGLPSAHAVGGNSDALRLRVRGELCERFKNAITAYAIAELPMQLVIEAKTSAEKRGMNAIGVLYSGIFQVGRLRLDASQ